MAALGARLVVAGTSSGVGKTTVATGLMAAFRAQGLVVASAKVGPDFIDPGYHALATGRPGRNLDAWMCGAEAIAPLAQRAAAGADLLVVEGVMGLFDGSADDGDLGSTAQVARLLGAPVVLVVDTRAMAASVAALVHGFAHWDRRVSVAGVVLNRVASDGHETMLREALEATGVPVLGALRRDGGLTWRDRHLGLVPVVERPAEVAAALDRLAATVAAGCDLRLIRALACAAPPLICGAAPSAAPPRPPSPAASKSASRLSGPVVAASSASPASPAGSNPPALADPVRRASGAGRGAGRPVRVAVASGAAFSFQYVDNLELLAEAGAEVVPFDPLHDEVLPEGVGGLVAGGGFPEVYGEALAANTGLLADVRRRVAGGLVTWAECGGLLWLSRSLDGHRLAGVVPAEATMTGRLTLGYRRAVLREDSPFGPRGTEVRGHEFHYSTVEPTGGALDLSSRFGSGRAGWASPTLLASYLHVHLASDPTLATNFVAAAGAAGGLGSG
jgi:cobyrinic acid a,c-diamide synthase